jgi:hypothetical protein
METICLQPLAYFSTIRRGGRPFGAPSRKPSLRKTSTAVRSILARTGPLSSCFPGANLGKAEEGDRLYALHVEYARMSYISPKNQKEYVYYDIHYILLLPHYLLIYIEWAQMRGFRCMKALHTTSPYVHTKVIPLLTVLRRGPKFHRVAVAADRSGSAGRSSRARLLP